MGSSFVDQAQTNLTYGTAALIDVLLNTSRNFKNFSLRCLLNWHFAS